jgi:hypothetical protein
MSGKSSQGGCEKIDAQTIRCGGVTYRQGGVHEDPRAAAAEMQKHPGAKFTKIDGGLFGQTTYKVWRPAGNAGQQRHAPTRRAGARR